MKRSLPDENKPNDGGRSKGPERDPQPILMPTVVMDRPSKVQKTLSKEQKAELLALRRQMKLEIAARKKEIVCSGVYTDDNYQYRHITLPKAFLRYLPNPKEEILLEEHEYRRLGISDMSSGWEHYMIYQPEPNILLLRRTHEMARKLKQEQQRLLAEQAKAKEAKEKAKAEQSQATTDSGASEPSTRPKRSITKPKTTSTVATNDQQKTNDQA